MLNFKTMGDMLAIIKLTKKHPVSLASYVKPWTAKLPQLNSEMTLTTLPEILDRLECIHKND